MSCNFGSRAVKSLAIVVVACVLATAVNSARAITVTNLSTNTVIFQDTFETESLGGPPIATVGSWDLSAGQTASTSVVQNTPPGPNDGAKDLYVSRPKINDIVGAPDVQPRALYSAVQSTVGDTIQIAFSMYVPTLGLTLGQTTFANNGIVLAVNGTGRRDYMIVSTQSKDINIDGVTVPTLTNAFHPDSWQNWTITYNIGNPNSTWNVDGTIWNQPTQLGTATPDATRFYVDLPVANTVYFDSFHPVPEPASLALMGLGGLGLARLWVRRKKSG